MKDYFAETDPVKCDTIAVLQLRDLEEHWHGKLRLDDVIKLLHEMNGKTKQP